MTRLAKPEKKAVKGTNARNLRQTLIQGNCAGSAKWPRNRLYFQVPDRSTAAQNGCALKQVNGGA